MAKVQLIRTAGGFLPDSEHDQDELASVHLGDVVAADIKKSRNPAFHRKAFAMLHTIFDNQDHFEDFEKFREWLQIQAGIAETSVWPDGRVHVSSRSLSFSSMDEIEFDRAYNGLITAAVRELGMDWLLMQYA